MVSFSEAGFLTSSSPPSVGKGLVARVWFTIWVLVICRLGSYIPIPGIDPEVLNSVVSKNVSGILGIFNLFSGGAFGRMTIFALNVMPYIVSSIVVQLLTVAIKGFSDVRHAGDSGRKKINLYIRSVTIVFAIFQAVVVLNGIEGDVGSSRSVVISPAFVFKVVGVFSLLGGTFLLIWLGESINANGIGNGISLIIFSGVISELPNAFTSLFMMSKNGILSVFGFIIVLLSFFALLLLIVCVERSFREVPIHYHKKQLGNKVYAARSNYIPLKINMAGVVPPIFASALLLSPATIANFNQDALWSSFVLEYFSSGKLLYILCYAVLIAFFCFFYTPFVFNSEETADLLRKNGGVVLGRRPGSATISYLEYVVLRLSVLGAIYLVSVCTIPELLRYYYDVPFFGGTSLLIVVSVILDTISQIQASLLTDRYHSLVKKSSSRSRKKL